MAWLCSLHRKRRKLQLEVDPKKRLACGRPGINGGYFDPSIKFGVNCYGVRPTQKKGDISSSTDKAFAASVQRIKGMVDNFSVYPFNKKSWSEYNNIQSSQTQLNDVSAPVGPIQTAGKGIEQTAESAVKGVYDTTGSLVTTVGKGMESIFEKIGSLFV